MIRQLHYLVILCTVLITAAASSEVPKRSNVPIPDPSLEPLYYSGGIVVLASDSGTDMGRATYEAIFGNCGVEFRVERYRIVDGVVEVSEY